MNGRGAFNTSTAETIAEDNSDGFNSTAANDLPWSEPTQASAKKEDSSISYFEKLAQEG